MSSSPSGASRRRLNRVDGLSALNGRAIFRVLGLDGSDAHRDDRPVMPDGGRGHSPDRLWWWDGYQWLAAVSPDGSFWFDGRRWIARKPRRSGRSTTTLAVTAAMWAGALSAAPCFLFNAASRAHWVTLPPSDYPPAIGLAALGVVATVMTGVILRRQASWAALPITAVGGTGVLAGWYIAMMDASYPATDPTVDNATGAGVAILGVPALAALCTLLALGMVMGRFIGRSRQFALPSS